LYREGENCYYRFLNDPEAKPLIVNANNYPDVFKEVEKFEAEIMGTEYIDGDSDDDIYSQYFTDGD